MKKFKQPIVPHLTVRLAEELSDELAQLTSPIEAAAWEIDSALSAIRKDDAGYRIGTKAEPNGGGSYVPGELEKAVRRGKQLLLALTALRELERQWEAEDGLTPLAFTPVEALHAA